MNGRAHKRAKTSSMNLLTKYETTLGYCQPAAGQFSQLKSFMLIKNANQRCLLASLVTASFAFEFIIKAGKNTLVSHTYFYSETQII